MREITALVPISLLLLWSLAGEPALSQVNDEQLIDALTTTDFSYPGRVDVYFADGASDGTVTELGASVKCEHETCVAPLPPLKAIAALGSKSIALLVEHLNDTRLTRATFQHKLVPVGFVALDLLMHFTDYHDSRVCIRDCADDGLVLSCIERRSMP